MNLLFIAYYLSIFTFYLGVLIYALPIPLTGLKKWAPRLITDAFFIAILTLSLTMLVNAADYIRGIVGGSWEEFLTQIRLTVLFRTTVVFLISVVSNVLSRFIPGINRLASLIINPILASLYSNMLLYSIATMVYKGIWIFTSLGIALMAIPFRIARNAGAFLLSFALVFYTALPLYPSFYKLLLYSPQTPLEMPLIYGSIVNEYGQPITDGYIGFEINSKNYVGPIPLYSGRYVLFTNLDSSLMSSPITIYFDVVGHQFYSNISNVNLYDLCTHSSSREFYLSICNIDILVKGLIVYRDGVAVHITPKASSVSVSIFTNENIRLAIDSQYDSELYISFVNTYDIEGIVIDGVALDSINDLTSYQWYWYNLVGSTYIVDIPQGIHLVEIKLRHTSELPVEPSEAYTYNAIQQISSFNNALLTDALNEISRIIYVDLVASIMYLSILVSISWGLSRLFGGSSRVRVLL